MKSDLLNNPIRTILVDDEELCRIDLRLKLKKHPEIEIVGEADCAEEGRQIFDETEPDLIILDIDMPDEDGFEFLESLPAIPFIIFASSHKECAIKAFDVKAQDFLEKPISAERLKLSIDRIKTRYLERNAKESEEENSSSNSFIQECGQFFLKDGNDCWFVQFDDLRLVESDGNYCKLYFNNEKRLVRKSINEMEQKLPKSQFFRANRQCLINFKYVKKLHTISPKIISVEMKDGSQITMSRRATQNLKMMMTI